MADLRERLERKRPGYDQEQQFHRLLIDAYTGGGGFAGANVQPPAGYWGAASEIYSSAYMSEHSSYTHRNQQRLTYLDRYVREDTEKFRRRINVAHYPNYIQPLTDLKLSFLLRKEMLVDGRPDQLIEWRENVDGRDTSWDEMLPLLAARAATVGWCPVVIDMPRQPTDGNGNLIDLPRSQANELGLRPALVPLFPGNLVDYHVDEGGSFTWAKIRTDYVTQETALSEPVEVTRFTIWTPRDFEIFEIYEDSNREPASVDRGEHSFGEVPIAILRHKPMLDDPIKGLPMHGQESIEARRLFNLHSELDEHMRSTVFALLVLSRDPNEQNKAVTIGSDNALSLDPAAQQKHYYMQPDGTSAASYETRIERCIREIYRQARVEFSRPDASRSAVSGIARKYEFAQTDRALAEFAHQIARFEEHIDMLVGRSLGVSEDRIDEIRITPPSTFDVEDLQTELQLAVDAVTQLSVGPTAERRILERVVQQMLPNLSEEDESSIEEEIEQAVNEKLQRDQFAAEALAEAPQDEEDEEDDTSNLLDAAARARATGRPQAVNLPE